jgi:protease I
MDETTADAIAGLGLRFTRRSKHKEANMNLADAQIAVLAENQYQELELWYPLLRLREEGANVVVVGPVAGQPYASKLGYPVVPDVSINDVDASDFDGVVIPGGFAPEGMRRHKPMIDFVRNVHDQGALVAAICHAGWVLASAGIAKDRNVTCVALIKDDVIHAGGKYVDQAVVRDGNIITSRLPSDLHVFGKEIVNYLKEATRRRNSAKVVKPTDGRASASPAYTHSAEFTMGPRGVASADYTGTVKIGDRVF